MSSIRSTRSQKNHCALLVRNECDILGTFLSYATSLFDHIYVVDIQSTDGTRDLLEEFSGRFPDGVSLFDYKSLWLSESAIMNSIARYAFLQKRADWLFFLDVGEFISLDQNELDDFLAEAKSGLVRLRFFNLVPEHYGSFDSFDLQQTFFVSPKASRLSKIAISFHYALLNPHFHISDGLSDVSPSPAEASERQLAQLNCFRIPVRSGERLGYRIRGPEAGLFPARYVDIQNDTKFSRSVRDGNMSAGTLNAIAAEDTGGDEVVSELFPHRLGWSTRRLPEQLFAADKRGGLSLTETLRKDRALVWDRQRFTASTPICADIRSREVRVRCLPTIAGRRLGYYRRYETLPSRAEHGETKIDANLAMTAMEAAFAQSDVVTGKHWAFFAPVINALFAISRPRRFVALGVGEGGGLFAAARAAEALSIDTQCIGIDQWEIPSDRNPPSQFDEFRRKLADNFPRQHFIRAHFSQAIESFDDRSIDILMIDFDMNYEDARHCFDMWLPKLSETGIVIVRSIQFGVVSSRIGSARLWSALANNFLSLAFHHNDGLGLCYTGKNFSPSLAAIQKINENPDLLNVFRSFMENYGRISTQNIRPYLENFLIDPKISRTVLNLLNFEFLRLKISRIFSIKSERKRSHYAQKEIALRHALEIFKAKTNDQLAAPRQPLEKCHDQDGEPRDIESNVALTNKPASNRYVEFNLRFAPRGLRKGLHPAIRLIIPTRGCSRWLSDFLDAYNKWGLHPTFAVDTACEPKTLEILRHRNCDIITVDSAQIRNGEGIMPFLSKHVEQDYILRLDDDEFPTTEFIDWTNSIPESRYSFVTSWWIPRLEVAMIDGELCTCHPKWLRVKAGNELYENLHGGRFYRHREVIYDEVGPHHGNFVSEYISHCPMSCPILHLDYLVRSPSERLEKLRAVEKRFPGAGWPFANHMVPEMAPRNLLFRKRFDYPNLEPLINSVKLKFGNFPQELRLTTSEIGYIQYDRLTADIIHFHY